MAGKRPNRTTAVREHTETPAPGAPAKSISTRVKLAVLLGIISLVAYANTLSNGFAMDDSLMITNNAIVAKGVKAIPELLTTPHIRGFDVTANDEYRPLALVLHSIERELWDLNPMPFHFISILLFAGCVVLLFLFLDKLFAGKTATAFVAATLFALHPIHTEVVANIKSCDEMLCFFFGMLCMMVFINYSERGKPAALIGGSLLLFLSFLAKETAFTLIGVMAVIFFLLRKEHAKRSMYIMACSVAVAACFMAVRVAVLKHYHVNLLPHVTMIENAMAKPGLSAESRLATAMLIMGYYVKLLFIPWPLLCDYSYNTIPFVHFSDARVLASCAVYVSLAVLCIVLFVKNPKSRYAFGIAFFLMTIAIFSNILIPIKSTMGERFLFYPSVGFCLVAAVLLERWAMKAGLRQEDILRSSRVRGALAVVGVTYLCITVYRNSDWKDNLTLYQTDLAKAPDNARLTYYLGYELFSIAREEINPANKNRMMGDVIPLFRRSLEIYPEQYAPAVNLGAAYFHVQQLDSAEVYDKLAIKLIPESAIARNNLSGVYLGRKEYQKDIALCRQSIAVVPGDIYAYADIALSYLSLGVYDSAVYYATKGISIDPKFYAYYDILGRVYYAKGIQDSVSRYEAILKSMRR
jgi:protein O-mannosyl-transferase